MAKSHALVKCEVTVWAAGNFSSTLDVVKPFRSSRVPLCLGLRQRQLTCIFLPGKGEGNGGGEPLKPLTCAQICPFVTSQACYTKGIWLVDRSVWWCYWCFELCSVASYFAAFTDDSLQRFGKTEPKISTCKAQRGGAKSCWVNVGDFFGGREGCR